MQRIFADDSEEEEDVAAPTEALVQSLQKLQPLFQLAHQLGLTSTAGVLSMPDVKPVQ
jgi:hypothetical protein